METNLTTCLTRQVQYNAPWHELKHVWVGRSYAPEFYAPVKNTQVRESLQKIARETEEDYINLNQGAESTVSYLMARLTLEKYFNKSEDKTAKTSKDFLRKPLKTNKQTI
jgi:hypothetical protein